VRGGSSPGTVINDADARAGCATFDEQTEKSFHGKWIIAPARQPGPERVPLKDRPETNFFAVAVMIEVVVIVLLLRGARGGAVGCHELNIQDRVVTVTSTECGELQVEHR